MTSKKFDSFAKKKKKPTVYGIDAYFEISTVADVGGVGIVGGVVPAVFGVVGVVFGGAIDVVEFDVLTIVICKFICSSFISWLNAFTTAYNRATMSALLSLSYNAFRNSS